MSVMFSDVLDKMPSYLFDDIKRFTDNFKGVSSSLENVYKMFVESYVHDYKGNVETTIPVVAGPMFFFQVKPKLV